MSAVASSLLRRGGAGIAVLDRHPLSCRVILLVLPRAVAGRFDATSAGDLTTEFELRVRLPDGDSPAPFAISIRDGQCRVRPGAPHSPGAAIEVSAGDLIRLASGAASWPQMLCSGRLKFRGDPFLAMRFPSLFQMPIGSD